MFNTVKMTAAALRSIMVESFDYEKYKQGRKDARELFKMSPELREEKVDEVKQRIESGNFRSTPDPSYWIGCLCETDFTW